MDKLLPCPFCGGEPEVVLRPDNLWGGYFCNVFCRCDNKYSAEAHKSARGADESDVYNKAIAAWNRRAQPENEPLTLDELRALDGEPVWIVVLDKTVFADKDDAINGWGLCRKSWVRLWDKARADIVHIDHDFEDYGKTWLAYRTKPERSEGE